MTGKMIYTAPPTIRRHECAPPTPRWLGLNPADPYNVDLTSGSIWQCDTCGRMWCFGGRAGWYQISERKARRSIEKGATR